MCLFLCPYVFHPDKQNFLNEINNSQQFYCSCLFSYFCRNPERKKRIGKKNCYHNDHKKTTQWATGQPRPWETE